MSIRANAAAVKGYLLRGALRPASFAVVRPTMERIFAWRGLRDGNADLGSVHSILVVRLDEIGDVVLSVPMLRALRQRFPSARISLVVKPGLEGLVETCPFVDEVLTFAGRHYSIRQRLERAFSALAFSRDQLWGRRIDLAIIPRWSSDDYTATWLAFSSGARLRVGYSEQVCPDKARANFGYDALSGTSMASPHVAGVAGLLLAQRPDLSNGQVREILRQSADDLGESGFDPYYGHGRVNAYGALQTPTPDEPVAPAAADCVCGPCGACTALAGEPEGQSILENLRAVRDQIFTEDPGQRWVRIYYEHQLEVAWLLASNEQLRTDATTGFSAFAPVFRAGLGEGPPVTLTPELIEAARRALMGVALHGSAAVHDDIVREWEKVDPYRFVGWNVLDVWEQLRFEEQATQIYLPIVIR